MAKWRGFGLPEASPRVPDVNAGAVLDSPMREFLTASPLAGCSSWSPFTPRSVVSPNFDLGRRRITKDLVVDRHRLEGPLVSGSGSRCRLSSRLHGSHIPFGVVWAIVPVEDDLVELHVSALDGDLHVLDVLLYPFALFGSDPRAWIGGLDRHLAEHEPLVFGCGRAHGAHQDDGR